MGNWKKRTQMKRQRLGDEAAAEADESQELLSHDVLERLGLHEDGGAAPTPPLELLSLTGGGPSSSTTSPASVNAHASSVPCPSGDEQGGRQKCPRCERSAGGLFCAPCFEAVDTAQFARVREMLPADEAFPLRVHIVFHPAEKLQKSSAAALTFLGSSAVETSWITASMFPLERWTTTSISAPSSSTGRGAGDKDNKMFPLERWTTTSTGASSSTGGAGIVAGDKPDKDHSSSSRVGAGSREKDSGPSSPPADGAADFRSRRRLPDLDEFLGRVSAEDCVLLLPGDDAVGVDTLFQRQGGLPLQKGSTTDVSSSPSPRKKIAILLDSSWHNVEKMLVHPVLNSLPRLKLSGRNTLFWRHHGRGGREDQGISRQHLCTAEATFWVLREAEMASSGEASDLPNSKFLAVLYFFLQQYRKIQRVYRVSGRDLKHIKGWVEGDVDAPCQGPRTISPASGDRGSSGASPGPSSGGN